MKATARNMVLQTFVLTCLAVFSDLPDLISTYIAIPIGRWVSADGHIIRVYAEQTPDVAGLIAKFGPGTGLLVSETVNILQYLAIFAFTVFVCSFLEKKLLESGCDGPRGSVLKLVAIMLLLLRGFKSFSIAFSDILLLPPELVVFVFYPALIMATVWLLMIVLWTKKTRWEVS